MNVEIELMEAGFFFNKGSGMHPEKPLVNVTWVKEDGKAYGAIETIENIFNPIPNYVNIPETVRLVVVEKYGDELKQYNLEGKN
tara:strand:+ start:159 stop:410 length:252 start_codon:yes stop_codon:yes gene_type:complete